MESDFVQGYRDGRDRNSPPPSANRSAKYRHSFMVGRRELHGLNPIPYREAMRMAEQAEAEDANR